MLMQNFGVTIKEHYGMLWYFLEWSILRVALSWPPRKPTVFARLARWQLVICNNTKDYFSWEPEKIYAKLTLATFASERFRDREKPD